MEKILNRKIFNLYLQNYTNFSEFIFRFRNYIILGNIFFTSYDQLRKYRTYTQIFWRNIKVT